MLQFIIVKPQRSQIDSRALEHRPHQGCFSTGKVTLIEWPLRKSSQKWTPLIQSDTNTYPNSDNSFIGVISLTNL